MHSHRSLRLVAMLPLWLPAIALAALVDQLSLAADPWPLGTFTVTAATDPTTPAGFTGLGFDVAAPGVTESASGFLAIGLHTTPTPRGLVMFFTGGTGTGWWSNLSETSAFAADLRDVGFMVVQLRWEDSWLHASPGNDAGTAHLGARPAAAIQYVYDNYYVPLGIAAAEVDRQGGGFIATGNSGGASQVAFALSHYGLDDILDAAIPTGGPPHAALAKSLMDVPSEARYHYPLDTRQFIDEGFGYFDGNGPGATHDETFIPRWLVESHSTGGNDYFHPETRVHFILGSGDVKQQTIASDYHDRLVAENSPSVTWEIAANTGHSVPKSPQGRAALWNAITAVPDVLAADFDEDGDVDGDDLTRWRNGYGTGTTHTQGDADADADVDGGDFLVWQRQLGWRAAGPVAATVPEPGSLALFGLACCGLGFRRQRRLVAPAAISDIMRQ